MGIDPITCLLKKIALSTTPCSLYSFLFLVFFYVFFGVLFLYTFHIMHSKHQDKAVSKSVSNKSLLGISTLTSIHSSILMSKTR
jgi:hypothetical protein